MKATPYHRAVSDYLELREPGLWQWAASTASADATGIQLQLLKTCYQLSPEAYPDLHATAAEVAATLGTTAAVSFYQANNDERLNAGVYLLGSEAHIVFHGPLMDLMSADELRAVIAHELAHVLLWQRQDGRYWRTMRILHRLADEERGAGVWSLTTSRYQQYTELFADQGAYLACGDIAPCIASLVKVQTGLKQVHVPSYIEQAGKILSQDASDSPAGTHPQSYVRAQALVLHAAGHSAAANKTNDDDENPGDAGAARNDTNAAQVTSAAAIARLLDGPLDSDKLDIIGQVEVHALTRKVLTRLLQPAWFRSDAVMALARRYFSDFAAAEPAQEQQPPQPPLQLPTPHRLGTYLSLVLIDFVCVDPGLEELPAAAALGLAEELGLSEDFERLLLKETKMKKPALAKLQANRAALLNSATATIGQPA